MERGPREYWQSCWWLKAFVNIQAYKSERHPAVNLNSQPAQHSLSASTVRWMAKATCDRNIKVLIHLSIFNLVSKWESNLINEGLTLESWQRTHHWRSMQLQAAQSQSPSLQWLILLINYNIINHTKELCIHQWTMVESSINAVKITRPCRT